MKIRIGDHEFPGILEIMVEDITITRDGFQIEDYYD